MKAVSITLCSLRWVVFWGRGLWLVVLRVGLVKSWKVRFFIFLFLFLLLLLEGNGFRVFETAWKRNKKKYFCIAKKNFVLEGWFEWKYQTLSLCVCVCVFVCVCVCVLGIAWVQSVSTSDYFLSFWKSLKCTCWRQSLVRSISINITHKSIFSDRN